MEFINYVSNLKSLLYPAVYPREIHELPDGLCMLFTRKTGITSRYALAITQWDGSNNGHEFLEERRRLVSKKLSSMWMFAEVGLFLVVLGENADWQDRLAEMSPDQTGLHATTIQGIHYVNTLNGEFEVKQSAWGPVTFGNAEVLSDLIASVPIEG